MPVGKQFSSRKNKFTSRMSTLSRILSILVATFVLLGSLSQLDAIPTGPDEPSTKKSYSGYKLLRTSALDQPDLAEALMLSLDGKHGVHFWTFPKTHQTTDILASPNLYPHVKSLLEELGVEHDIVHDDIDQLIQEENVPVEVAPETGRQLATGHRMNWSNYQRYNVIQEYCQYLANLGRRTATGATVSMETIGKTGEGRDIVLVKLSSGGEKKPAIWIDGGMHAREWISPATALYILNKLVTDEEKSREMLKDFDWYFVPVINVDGYEYSHTKDRFWRKTRSRTTSFLGCRGVDPNRNWGYKWGGAGTSNDPCSEIYRGPRAFSEPETSSVSNAILARRDHILMYLTFHSYSQLMLVPWGYGKEKPSDYSELMSVAAKGKQALEATYGTRYQLGTAPDLLYSAAGGSDDWAKGGAGIKYAYTFELRDTGRYGFALPANQIIPTGEETFNAVRALAATLGEQQKGRRPGLQQKLPINPIRLPSRIPSLGGHGVISAKDFPVGSNDYPSSFNDEVEAYSP